MTLTLGALCILASATWVGSCADSDTPEHHGTTSTNVSSTGTASTATDETGESATTESPDPSRPMPPPYVLPEHCGDGIIESGRYDCFVPVPIDWVDEALGMTAGFDYFGVDLDRDGRDEVLVRQNNGYMFLLRWNGDGFDLDTSTIQNEDTLFGDRLVETRWDWTGDGLDDLTLLGGYGVVHQRPQGPAFGLGPVQEVLVPTIPPPEDTKGPWGLQGLAMPIDIESDGQPELLVSEVVGDPASANPIEDLVLYRQVDGQWQAEGARVRFEPCGAPGAFARGDFDGDGDEDLAVVDIAQFCDPFPADYDPQWYRVGVFLANPSAGTLDLGGWYPTGGVYEETRLWARDVNADGRLDLVLQIIVRLPSSDCEKGTCKYQRLAVMHGRGDGTFQEGEPVDVGPQLPNNPVQYLGDLDGDGDEEWMVDLHEGRPWVIPLDFSPDGVAPLVALNEPQMGGVTHLMGAKGRPIADVNGDGVDDYLVRTVVTDRVLPIEGKYWMVSKP